MCVNASVPTRHDTPTILIAVPQTESSETQQSPDPEQKLSAHPTEHSRTSQNRKQYSAPDVDKMPGLGRSEVHSHHVEMPRRFSQATEPQKRRLLEPPVSSQILLSELFLERPPLRLWGRTYFLTHSTVLTLTLALSSAPTCDHGK